MEPAPRFDWHHAAAGLLALGLGALATADEPLKPWRAAQALISEQVAGLSGGDADSAERLPGP